MKNKISCVLIDNCCYSLGDQILTINDKNLRGLTHAQAVDYLQNCHSHISILVSRMVDRNTEIGKNFISKSQLAITFSKLAIEPLEPGVKYVQS